MSKPKYVISIAQVLGRYDVAIYRDGEHIHTLTGFISKQKAQDAADSFIFKLINKTAERKSNPLAKARKYYEDALADSIHIDIGSHNTRGKNPAPRKGASRPRRVSQITKKPPTKRLVARRRANTQAGYFPNPAPYDIWESKTDVTALDLDAMRYFVQSGKHGNWATHAAFYSKKDAIAYAEQRAAISSHQWRIAS